jgi:hypothetical protein
MVMIKMVDRVKSVPQRREAADNLRRLGYRVHIRDYTAVSLFGSDILRDERTDERIVRVKTGGIGYSDGRLVSSGFYYCSAVILDFGKSALMAHALPAYDLRYPSSRVVFVYNDCMEASVGSIVNVLIEESRILGLDPKGGSALINAGMKKSLDLLVSDFESAGIAILEASSSTTFKRRRVEYDPRHRKMLVELE